MATATADIASVDDAAAEEDAAADDVEEDGHKLCDFPSGPCAAARTGDAPYETKSASRALNLSALSPVLAPGCAFLSLMTSERQQQLRYSRRGTWRVLEPIKVLLQGPKQIPKSLH